MLDQPLSTVHDAVVRGVSWTNLIVGCRLPWLGGVVTPNDLDLLHSTDQAALVRGVVTLDELDQQHNAVQPALVWVVVTPGPMDKLHSMDSLGISLLDSQLFPGYTDETMGDIHCSALYFL